MCVWRKEFYTKVKGKPQSPAKLKPSGIQPKGDVLDCSRTVAQLSQSVVALVAAATEVFKRRSEGNQKTACHGLSKENPLSLGW